MVGNYLRSYLSSNLSSHLMSNVGCPGAPATCDSEMEVPINKETETVCMGRTDTGVSRRPLSS